MSDLLTPEALERARAEALGLSPPRRTCRRWPPPGPPRSATAARSRWPAASMGALPGPETGRGRPSGQRGARRRSRPRTTHAAPSWSPSATRGPWSRRRSTSPPCPAGCPPGARHPLTTLQERVVDVFVGDGLGGGRGPRGRARVVQLRRAELPQGPPGARDAGHPVRRAGGQRAGAAHAHQPGAGPLAARPRAAGLRRVPGPGLPGRRARRHPLAGLRASSRGSRSTRG